MGREGGDSPTQTKERATTTSKNLPQGAPSGHRDSVGWLAASFHSSNGLVGAAHHFVWGGVGKVRLWYTAADAALAEVRVAFNGTSLSPREQGAAGVTVAVQGAKECRAQPQVPATAQTAKASGNARSDERVHGGSATLLRNPFRAFCEARKL